MRIGPDPPGERVQAPERLYHVLAGPEVEVVRVPEDDVGPEPGDLLRQERLDRPLRADGHERGRPDLPVRGPDDAGTRSAVRRLEREAAHAATLEEQHRVTERVEPVPLADRERVELTRPLDAGEGHHEGEQRRPREVEVRQQRVDRCGTRNLA